MCSCTSWHPRQGNAWQHLQEESNSYHKKKNQLPGKKPQWEFAEVGGNGPFTRKTFSFAFKWNWEAGGDGEVSQSLSALLIDRMTLILLRIAGIRSGKTYLVITQPSKRKHLLLLIQLLSEITDLAGGPAWPREFCASGIIPSGKCKGIFLFLLFSCFSPSIWNTFSMAWLSVIKFASIGFLMGTPFSQHAVKTPVSDLAASVPQGIKFWGFALGSKLDFKERRARSYWLLLLFWLFLVHTLNPLPPSLARSQMSPLYPWPRGADEQTAPAVNLTLQQCLPFPSRLVFHSTPFPTKFTSVIQLSFSPSGWHIQQGSCS